MHSTHGRCLTKAERFAEAETELTGAHAIFHEIFGPDNRRTVAVVRGLLELYDAWGRPDQAAEWQARLPTTQPTTAATEDRSTGE
jgi:hypothetical protein